MDRLATDSCYASMYVARMNVSLTTSESRVLASDPTSSDPPHRHPRPLRALMTPVGRRKAVDLGVFRAFMGGTCQIFPKLLIRANQSVQIAVNRPPSPSNARKPPTTLVGIAIETIGEHLGNSAAGGDTLKLRQGQGPYPITNASPTDDKPIETSLELQLHLE